MNKKIKIEIRPDGHVIAKTIGMNDISCLDYIEVLERVVDAKTIDSSYTEEFLQANQQHISHQELTKLKKLQVKGD